MSPQGRERTAPRIRRRFTLLFAGTLLCMLGAAAIVMRLAMREALQREFERQVRASAALVAQFFRVEIEEYQTTEATLTHITSELVFEDRIIHVRRPDGTEFGVVGSPRPHRHRPLIEPVTHVEFPLSPELAPGWMIAVDASAAGMAAVEARIDRWILLGIPALVVLAGLAGWWLTGRTLRPVGRMALAAARIEPGTGGRIPVDDPEDELGRLGMRFNALLDRLDGALEQQRRFIADAAHELRTPLARLRSRVEVALLPSENASSPAAAASDVLPAVQDDVVRMARLVDELLQLARADAGRDGVPAAMHALYLDDIVTDELHRWHAAAERAGITLACSALQEAPVHGDDQLLRRLIGILVDNALRYGHPGGHVDVRVTAADDEVVLEVEDDGIGLTADDRARVFERFYRGERARALRSDGSGLGLAIAQWIVREHRGTISLEPGARGKGTRARVALARDNKR